MVDLKEFQLAAVQRICERLADRSGPRRFLLADEVGLGKTMVAQRVIERMASKRHELTVVYICSNAEIAAQNVRKLVGGERAHLHADERLTLLALQTRNIDALRRAGKVQCFAFTPGTSLKVGRSTGLARERRLLLFLVGRALRRPAEQAKWRRFFCCGSNEERWMKATSSAELAGEFERKISTDFQKRLRSEWRVTSVHLPQHASKGAPQERMAPLVEELDRAIDEFHRSGSTVFRSRLIGALRLGLAKVALDYLEPGLILLDEVQRFKDVLERSREPGSIEAKLFQKKKAAILILSATPYKMYSLAHEAEDHYSDFRDTLAFLRRRKPDDPSMTDLEKRFECYRDRLMDEKVLHSHDAELVKLKVTIEEELKQVMCRMERGWYIDDPQKGIQEVPGQLHCGVVPSQGELAEFVRLRRFLLDRVDSAYRITDFWKSCPSILTFMHGHYKLIERLRKEKHRIPRGLVSRSEQLARLPEQNLKFRHLFEKIFNFAGVVEGTGGAQTQREPRQPWRYLWVRPTYTYHRDEFYGIHEPSKCLIFSHWRFLPRAMAILASQEVETRVGRIGPRRSPLSFKQKMSFQSFDVAYPAVSLALQVRPLEIASRLTSDGRLPTLAAVRQEAERVVRQMLSAAGVDVVVRRPSRLWQVVARLESRSGLRAAVEEAAQAPLSADDHEDISVHYEQHQNRFLGWLNDDEGRLRITRRWVKRLTSIALFSPSVSLLRALLGVYPHDDFPIETWLPELFESCLGGLRQYFNRPLVQTIVRRSGGEGTYTDRVLTYCGQAHLQAVLDEHAYLACQVLQKKTPSEAIRHFAEVLDIGASSPRVNVLGPNRSLQPEGKARAAHFALAFGDDTAKEERQDHKGKSRMRKTSVREAFNSPFWPFVLTTTSVGQEGLDFHLYCRDIVHWNLPGNPVDLEQREGRINRFDGLNIRRSLATDHPLPTLAQFKAGATGNAWIWAFAKAEAESGSSQRSKRGLHPHWVYEPTGPFEAARLRRHLLFFEGSHDRRRYLELKQALSLYRLVFGQPRQKDLLDRLASRLGEAAAAGGEIDASARLRSYMINLTPFGRESPVVEPTDMHPVVR